VTIKEKYGIKSFTKKLPIPKNRNSFWMLP